MTFAATIQADVLDDALAPVSALVSECKLRTEADGLAMTAVDPANVAMVDVELDASACAHYDADGGVLGVNLERLTDVLGMADDEDMVDLHLDAETRKLEIDIGGLEYTLALIDPDSIRAEPDIPDLDLPGTFVAAGQHFGRGVTAADLVSDHVELTAQDGDALKILADGDTDDVEVTIGEDELLSGRHDGNGPTSSLFSLDYLEDMFGPVDRDDDVSVLLGDEMPVKLRYSTADGDVSVLNMLAPRIQSD